MTFREQLKQQGFHEGILQGMERGMKKGILQGTEQGMKKVAKKMLASGVDRDFIQEMTGLLEAKLFALEREVE
jgi:predicted transposase/invertase (TIGR01784 family)